MPETRHSRGARNYGAFKECFLARITLRHKWHFAVYTAITSVRPGIISLQIGLPPGIGSYTRAKTSAPVRRLAG